jgi:hypothetical protein
MRRHGRGPKDIFVHKYPRWVRGYRKRVGNHKRGLDPKHPKRVTEEQLSFDFF